MHRGNHQKSKLSIFKSNRSQASLLSNVSASSPSELQTPQQQHQQRGDRLLRISPQPSPIDSPLYSPNSISASPLGPDDDRSPFQEYNTAPAEQFESNPPPVQSPSPRKLRRSLSHRSYSVGVGSQSGSAPKTTPKPDNNAAEQRTLSNSTRNSQQEKSAPEQKKKRRFFGLGEQSSSKDKPQNSSKTLGRSLSTRTSQPPLTTTTTTATATVTAATSSGQPISRPRWPASPNLPSPAEEEEQPHGEIHARKLHNRHSVAFPNPTVPEEFRSLIGSGAIDINKTYNTVRAEETPVTTASNQIPSGQGGAQRTPIWDRVEHRPGRHNRTVSTDYHGIYAQQQTPAHGSSAGRQATRPELNYPESQQQNSRPSSRQSVDPPSPSHSQLAFHHKSPSTQSVSSINDMGPPQPQHTPSSRSTDTPQPSSQSGSREGMLRL